MSGIWEVYLWRVTGKNIRSNSGNCHIVGIGDLLYVFPCVIFVLVFFSLFSIAITSLGEERANLSAFRTFVRFVLV